MLAVVGMAITGCSKTEVENVAADVQTGKIGFSTLVSKGTRATALSTANINSFQVYGAYKKNSSDLIRIFDDEKVYKNGESKWVYDGDARYWVEGAQYDFYAYSNGNEKLGSGAGRANFVGGILNIADYLTDNDHQNDLVFASKKAVGAAQGQNSTVNFAFQHLLSRVRFKFVYGFPEGYEIKISKARLYNIRNSGKYNGATEAGVQEAGWTDIKRVEGENNNPPIAFTFSGASTGVISNDSKEVLSQDLYVIPHRYTTADVDLLFTIDVTYNGEPIISREVKGTWAPKWEMGCSYSYEVSLSGATAGGMDKIEFGVESVGSSTEDGWTAGSDNPNFTFESSLPETSETPAA